MARSAELTLDPVKRWNTYCNEISQRSFCCSNTTVYVSVLLNKLFSVIRFGANVIGSFKSIAFWINEFLFVVANWQQTFQNKRSVTRTNSLYLLIRESHLFRVSSRNFHQSYLWVLHVFSTIFFFFFFFFEIHFFDWYFIKLD